MTALTDIRPNPTHPSSCLVCYPPSKTPTPPPSTPIANATSPAVYKVSQAYSQIFRDLPAALPVDIRGGVALELTKELVATRAIR